MSQLNHTFLEDPETLQALIELMWETSDAILTIYLSDDWGIATKGDQSPVTKADLAAH